MWFIVLMSSNIVSFKILSVLINSKKLLMGLLEMNSLEWFNDVAFFTYMVRQRGKGVKVV